MQKTKVILLSLIFLILPLFVNAVSLGQEVNFNIDSSYDLYSRKEIPAVLQKITNQIYFYVDKEWWQGLDYSKKQSLDVEIYNLSIEFELKIYPTLTSTFGSEPKPGIDGDETITVLIHPMIKDAAGYFNSGDVYSKLQYTKSNEREMVYLNSQYINKPEAKSFLAHEFLHLITVNQKDLLRSVDEEVWLNEARAEYASTLLGYDETYKGSNLERRVKAFLEKPSDSLTEWLNKKEDYGAINLFTQYLVDHYGVKILVDSLQSSKTGIDSINYALEKNGLKKDFSQIFSDWLITVLVNDCQLGERYCYLNKHLKDLRITPTFYYLPRAETVLSTYHNATYWSANWHRFIGGLSNLTLEFEGTGSAEFEIPYLLCDLKDNCSVEFFHLDSAEQTGKITFSEFNVKYSSLTIIPFIKNKTSGFDGREDSFSFSWKVTTVAKQEEVKEEVEEEKPIEEMSVEELEAKIAQIIALISQLKVQLAELIGSAIYEGIPSGFKFETNLSYGMRNNDVRYLQEFLKSQGKDIYPEGLVTGNFLFWTEAAVIRFQKKYQEEILGPWELTKGTGFVGRTTRAQLNELLAGAQ